MLVSRVWLLALHGDDALRPAIVELYVASLMHPDQVAALNHSARDYMEAACVYIGLHASSLLQPPLLLFCHAAS